MAWRGDGDRSVGLDIISLNMGILVDGTGNDQLTSFCGRRGVGHLVLPASHGFIISSACYICIWYVSTCRAYGQWHVNGEIVAGLKEN